MKKSLIRKAVATVTGCDNQFRSPKKYAVDDYVKPLILIVGFMRMHGYEDEDIMDELGVQNEKKYKQICRIFDGFIELGATGKTKQGTKARRAWNQICLIQRYIVLNNKEWIATEQLLKI